MLISPKSLLYSQGMFTLSLHSSYMLGTVQTCRFSSEAACFAPWATWWCFTAISLQRTPPPTRRSNEMRSPVPQVPFCFGGWCYTHFVALGLYYSGWKESCTTLNGWNPINNGINSLSTGAGFLPSRVGWEKLNEKCGVLSLFTHPNNSEAFQLLHICWPIQPSAPYKQ